MIYRHVPRTNWMLSALTAGTGRFVDDESSIAAMRKAIELGVNYFDVAPAYGEQRSEYRVGQAIKGCRDRVIVIGKSSPGNGGEEPGEYKPDTGFGIRSAAEVRFQIERTMRIMEVDHLDMYYLWSTHADLVFAEAMKPGGFIEGVERARADGLLDTIGLTSHIDADGLIRFCEQYPFGTVTIPFHLRDSSRARAVAYCHEHGIGVIAMNPLAGGSLARSSPPLDRIAQDLGIASMREAALRYVAHYPGITSALVGITYAAHAIEGAEIIEQGPLPEGVGEKLRERVDELYANVKHLCTGCKYCGECPQGVRIPEVLEAYSNLLVPSIADETLARLRRRLAEAPEGLDPSLCTACGTCEAKCPNRLPVSEMMAEAAGRWPGRSGA
jgi:uncharacterized protein